MLRFGRVVAALAVGVFLSAGFSDAAHADVLSTEELRAVQAKLKASDYLSVDLVQTKTSPTRPNRPVKSEGSARFAKPDRFVWTIGDPINEQTIFDGSRLLKVYPTEKVGVRYRAQGTESQELKRIVDLVLNMDSLFDNYVLKQAEMKDGVVNVQLTPKAANEVEQVDLQLDTKLNFIRNLRFQLRTRMILAIEFRNPSRDPVPGSAFDVPPGIKLSEMK